MPELRVAFGTRARLTGALRRYRSAIIWAIKLLVVAVPLYLLLRDGRFDLRAQSALLEMPGLLAGLFCIWLASFVWLVAWRWSLLAGALGLKLPLGFAVKTHLAGVFLSSWLPGGIGGDIWKAYRFGAFSAEKSGRGPAYFSVLLDRGLGLYALTLWGAICVVIDLPLWTASRYWPLALTLLLVCVVVSLAGTVLLLTPWIGAGASRKAGGDGRGVAGRVATLVRHLGMLRARRGQLLACFALSMLIQAANILFLLYITNAISGQPVGFPVVGAVFAIGIIVTILSMAPGGLGVGHLMFDVLLLDLGIQSGADIFNLFFLLTTLFSIIGLPLYLFAGQKRHPQPQ